MNIMSVPAKNSVKVQTGGLMGLLPAMPSALPLLVLLPVLAGSRTPRAARQASAPGSDAVSAAATPSAPAEAQPAPSPPPGFPARKPSPRRLPPITERFPAPARPASPPPAPVSDQADDPPDPPRTTETAPLRRRITPPMDILGFLSDASPYIPNMNQQPISQIMQARNIMGQLRSLRSSGASVSSAAVQTPRPASEIPLGLISALRRNMQGSVPSNLSRAEQAMQIIGTLRGGTSSLLQTISGFMQNADSAAVDVPIQAEGHVVEQPETSPSQISEMENKIGGVLNKALVNMDDAKRQQFFKTAQDILNKMK